MHIVYLLAGLVVIGAVGMWWGFRNSVTIEEDPVDADEEEET